MECAGCMCVWGGAGGKLVCINVILADVGKLSRYFARSPVILTTDRTNPLMVSKLTSFKVNKKKVPLMNLFWRV